MSVQAYQRCPRCGNENRGDSFVCSFCGKRLKVEAIENVLFFKRIETEWINPAPWYLKILWLFIHPNKAFWDINHNRSKAPGHLILLFNSLMYGLVGLALISHFSPPYPNSAFLFNFTAFTLFFLLGLFFSYFFGTLLIWFFIKGANYAVGFSEKLEARFGAVGQKEMYKEAEMSPFSIYKGGTLSQTQSHKFKMLYCAFSPFLIINLIDILIILIAFPTSPIPLSFTPNLFRAVFSSPIWVILNTIDALTIAIWVPILIALAIRELSNSSTLRVLLASLAIGIIVAILVYFIRPVFIS
jgi:hypothetical protein